MSDAPFYNRWYDRHVNLSLAVKLLLLFPDAVQSIVCEAIMLIADREFDANEKMKSFRTLGRERILGLYKSKNKRRDYDQNELMHRAMNYLFILSEDNREFMADHILKMVQYIEHYFQTCHRAQMNPSPETIADITRTYMENGGKETEQFLHQLREEFYQKLLTGQGVAPRINCRESISTKGSSDMRVCALD
jgi:hypothetical protein